MLEWTYRIGLGLIVVMGLMAFATTIRAPNGYGRYLGSKLEGTIAARPGWLIFEAPQWMAFALTFWLTARASNINTATLLLFGLWQAHYLYRGLAMPFLMQIGRKRLPIATIWFGLPFNALNGFVNGYASSRGWRSRGWAGRSTSIRTICCSGCASPARPGIACPMAGCFASSPAPIISARSCCGLVGA